MLSWLKYILALASGLVEWLNRTAPARERKELERQIDADTKAVVEKDAAAVNKRLDQLLKTVAIGTMLYCVGCSMLPSKPVYIDGDKKVTPMVLDGKAGWFVPDARMIEIMAALEKAKGN